MEKQMENEMKNEKQGIISVWGGLAVQPERDTIEIIQRAE